MPMLFIDKIAIVVTLLDIYLYRCAGRCLSYLVGYSRVRSSSDGACNSMMSVLHVFSGFAAIQK